PTTPRPLPYTTLFRSRRALAAVLRVDETSLDPAAPLTSFGVDSLMAFEFKLRIDHDFKTNVPVDRLSAGATLGELAAMLTHQLTDRKRTRLNSSPGSI